MRLMSDSLDSTCCKPPAVSSMQTVASLARAVALRAPPASTACSPKGWPAVKVAKTWPVLLSSSSTVPCLMM
jgi:hypothetical protein